MLGDLRKTQKYKVSISVLRIGKKLFTVNPSYKPMGHYRFHDSDPWVNNVISPTFRPPNAISYPRVYIDNDPGY
jgi:hypothetical protein